MTNSLSVLEALLVKLPHLRTQLYFKSSLTALSHAMEDQILAGGAEAPLVIASFQRERFYRQEARRYSRIADRTPQVYVLAAPETEFSSRSEDYEMVAFAPHDSLTQEWHLVVLGKQYSTCLICREREITPLQPGEVLAMDQFRRFEGLWTFDRQVAIEVARILLDRVLDYRPELATKIQQARTQFLKGQKSGKYNVDPAPFADRLVTYLQAGQYKLLKAYRSISAKERNERLANSIATAIRRSLNPQEILTVATQELGQALRSCRCLMYQCKVTDQQAILQHEFHRESVASLAGQSWPLAQNTIFQTVAQTRDLVFVEDTQTLSLEDPDPLKALIEKWQITSWLVVPVLYQERLLGVIELHHCGPLTHEWGDSERLLVESIANQVGVALIQAEAYANLQDLNQQLEALDRTRSNLIAITGHELRTPLSTIQVCLESLANEPDMPVDVQQVMLNTALEDSRRLQQLVRDFLTLSKWESGQVDWHLESLRLRECVDLVVSSLQVRHRDQPLPKIQTQISQNLPLVKVDGEWLVEMLTKLLDNACKFTPPDGKITIQAKSNSNQMLEVIVADTGRGIEPNRLETVFDRFYQEEGALRRTAGGTGLGLAICRQIVKGLGGQIWAESAGKDQGSEFHFTLPIGEVAADMPVRT